MDINKTKVDVDTLISTIKVAIKNGYNLNNSPITIRENCLYVDCYLAVCSKSYYNLIFNHEFVKCLFGECTKWIEIVEGEANGTVDIEEKQSIEIAIESNTINYRSLEEYNGWRRYLQQMVLEKEPLDYIYKFLSNKENINDN